MTTDFDPYRQWLGIAPGRRPPTYYELLGISLDEDDPAVIAGAAERQRSHVAKFAHGKTREAAAQLLYQIDEAKLTLLDADMRRDYDRRLGLFEKRKAGRQADPFARPRRIRGGSRTVGEESGIAKELFGVMSVIVGAFAVMLVLTFAVWPKKNADERPKMPAPPPQAADEQAAGDPEPARLERQPEPAPQEPAAAAATRPDDEGDVAWMPLFNGRNLDGWKFMVTPGAAGKPAAEDTWKVDAARGVLIARSAGEHWLETDSSYGDFRLELEWRFPSGGHTNPNGNGTGIVVRADGVSDGRLDPRGIEVDLRTLEPEHGRWGTGYLVSYDTAVENHAGAASPTQRHLPSQNTAQLKPAGEWNRCEIICEGDRISVNINGETINSGRKLGRAAGRICLRSQDTDVEFRKIRLAPVDGGRTDPVVSAPADPSLNGASPSEPGMVSLFNGRNLSGWEQKTMILLGGGRVRIGPTDKLWAVRDGVILDVGGQGSRGFLQSAEGYGSFLLELEFRLPAGGNTGVLFRLPDGEENPSSSGMEVQILDDAPGRPAQTGVIWGIAAAAPRTLRPAGEWNTLRLRCDQGRVQVWVNGTQTADVDIAAEAKLKNRPKFGRIGFTAEGKTAEGPGFRNIRIKRLGTKTQN